MRTDAQYWIEENGGKFRTARKDHACDNEHWNKSDCLKVIKKGDKYLDTNELKGPYKTAKHCMNCANILTKY